MKTEAKTPSGGGFTFGDWWNSMTEKVAPPYEMKGADTSENKYLVVAAFAVIAIVLLGTFMLIKNRV